MAKRFHLKCKKELAEVAFEGVGEACRQLIAKAAVAWKEEEGDYRDDITVCIVLLQPVNDALEAAAAHGS